MKYSFKEVGITRSKSGTCPVCNKKCTRKKYFYQTISPFNKNDDGTIKTSQQIYDEIGKESDKWSKESVKHAKCE